MKYVLDASVAVKWVLPEPDSDKALAIRDDFRKGLHDLLSPDTFAVEVAHALTRAERRKLIPQGDGLIKLADILSTAPRFHAYLPLLPRAAEISSQLWLGVYDCLYLALAEQEQCELVTADVRTINAVHSQFPHVILLSSLP